MRPLVPMREALSDPALLGEAIPGLSWLPWRVLLIAAMGEALEPAERRLFESLTGRAREPSQLVEEFTGIAGRRSGKTRAAATLAAYVGTLIDHSNVLASGERGVIPILSASVSQAGRAFQHALGVLQGSPVLSRQIDGAPTSDTIRLTGRIDIEVRPANFKTIRSITAVCAVADEAAFWNIEGTTNPDTEVLNALRPALATTAGPLWVISSPYAKKGEVYGAFRRHYGPEGDPRILVAKGPSRAFNSTLPQSVVDRAYERDPTAAAAEYGGEFRNDIEQFVDRDTVEACVARDVRERPPASNLQYAAFCDPSGGSNDSFTLAVAHLEGDVVILDCLRERCPPFSPQGVVAEFAEVLKSYSVGAVTGDRYGGEFPRELFRLHGISYEIAEKPRSELYRDELLPRLNGGQVQLLDLPKLVDQIANLERRVSRGGRGREIIDHPPHAHDDLANALAGALAVAGRPVQIATLHRVRFGAA